MLAPLRGKRANRVSISPPRQNRDIWLNSGTTRLARRSQAPPATAPVLVEARGRRAVLSLRDPTKRWSGHPLFSAFAATRSPLPELNPVPRAPSQRPWATESNAGPELGRRSPQNVITLLNSWCCDRRPGSALRRTVRAVRIGKLCRSCRSSVFHQLNVSCLRNPGAVELFRCFCMR